jgi:two-component system, OmpR family, sensor histidine kinase KdpD
MPTDDGRRPPLPDDIVDTVSHGVRTPLMVITTNAQLIRRLASDGDHGELVQRSTTDIAHAATRLLQLFDDLVDFYRLEQAAIEPRLEPSRIGDLLGTTLDRARRTLDHALELEVSSELPSLLVDAQLLERAVRHLLANAAAYSPAKRAVLLRASVRDAVACIDVVDSGPGIAEQDLERIFEPFCRLPGSRGGVGLGLYLARRFVEAMGGEVTVASTLGAGSVFTVTLPVR